MYRLHILFSIWDLHPASAGASNGTPPEYLEAPSPAHGFASNASPPAAGAEAHLPVPSGNLLHSSCKMVQLWLIYIDLPTKNDDCPFLC